MNFLRSSNLFSSACPVFDVRTNAWESANQRPLSFLAKRALQTILLPDLRTNTSTWQTATMTFQPGIQKTACCAQVAVCSSGVVFKQLDGLESSSLLEKKTPVDCGDLPTPPTYFVPHVCLNLDYAEFHPPLKKKIQISSPGIDAPFAEENTTTACIEIPLFDRSRLCFTFSSLEERKLFSSSLHAAWHEAIK